jgi:AcrR family transcriptional regulator
MPSSNADPGRRERKRNQTLDHLAATAFQLFEEQGFDAVTMEQIAAAADVAKGTLYNHFPVKEALLAHQFHRELAEGVADMRAEVEAEPTFARRLARMLRSSAEWYRRRRAYLAPYLRHRLNNNAPSSGIDLIFAALIARAQDAGELRRDLPAEHLGNLFKQLFFGAVMRWLMQPERDLDAEFAVIIDLFINGAADRGQA